MVRRDVLIKQDMLDAGLPVRTLGTRGGNVVIVETERDLTPQEQTRADAILAAFPNEQVTPDEFATWQARRRKAEDVKRLDDDAAMLAAWIAIAARDLSLTTAAEVIQRAKELRQAASIVAAAGRVGP